LLFAGSARPIGCGEWPVRGELLLRGLSRSARRVMTQSPGRGQDGQANNRVYPLGGIVPQVVLVFDPSLEVDASAMAERWANDEEVRDNLAGEPGVRQQPTTTYHLPEVIEYVVIPLAVNLGSSGLIEITRRLLEKYRPGAKASIEVLDSEDGGQTVVITDEDRGDETDS
jgi:hypothetical protein